VRTASHEGIAAGSGRFILKPQPIKSFICFVEGFVFLPVESNVSDLKKDASDHYESNNNVSITVIQFKIDQSSVTPP
jgi:hypothetical protein